LIPPLFSACVSRERWSLLTKPKTEGEESVKIKTNVKASGFTLNHIQTATRGLKIKISVKAGGPVLQHNQTLARGLKVKSGVKAGRLDPYK
jgi:hypothetical protein